MVFIYRPPLTATPSGNDERLAQSSSNKLMLQTPGLFCILSVIPRTLKIEEIRHHNTVTTERASTATN